MTKIRTMQFTGTQSRYGTVFILIALSLLVFIWFLNDLVRSMSGTKQCPYIWHGGSPTDSHRGSCWCGADNYCMCTPSLAIDCIIEYGDSVVLVWRKDPPADTFAIPGGFVSVGETVESATIREVKEETNLTLNSLEQFRVYSDPSRDARRHTVSMVFRGTVASVADLHTGDDAKSVKVVPLAEVLTLALAFDHRKIFEEYLARFHPDLVKL